MSKSLAISQKTVAVFVGTLLAAMFFIGAVAPAHAQTSALSESQIQSILNLLSSFGADQETIDNVDGALRGEAVEGGGGAGVASVCPYEWTRNLSVGSQGDDVINLQQFLNEDPDTRLAVTGAGSPGNETDYYGPITAAAVAEFQDKHAAQVLTPLGLSAGVGYPFGPSTRAYINSLCTTAPEGGGTGTTPTGDVNLSSNGQPANGLFVLSAARVPFTKFTVTNNGSSAVTLNSVTVQMAGSISRDAFDDILLLDGSGNQLGDGRSLNSNDRATVGKSTTIPAGSSRTFTVAANAPTSSQGNAGEVGGLNVVSLNTSASVSGSLPISGAQHTVNESLSIGSVTIDEGTNDPDVDRDQELGTTDYRFSSVRVEAGSEEDIRLHSVRWTQNGSSDLSDLSNLEVEVDGTEYPVTMDGDTVTATFGSGIVIPEGDNVDVSISGDITGSGANGDTVQFDIEETYDIYVSGETFGHGILPTAAGTGGSAGDAGSDFPTSGNPFFDGSKVTITGGSVNTISNSNSVPAQNVSENVSDQPLGGFTTNLLGEALEVDGLTFGITTTGTGAQDASGITNITLVNENGSVVAGPVDGTAGGTNNGTIVFSDLIEFPVGSQTYTLQGELSTNFDDGDTVKATTTVNTTYWEDPEGVDTGDAYTLPGNTVTMNTMTVKAGSLNVNVGSTPAQQTVVAGVNDFLFTNYIFDATASGEDVRFSSIPLEANGTLTATSSEINGCQLFDGSTALNRGTNVINGGDIANGTSDTTFTFNDTFTVPKGTSKTVELRCNVASGATGTFSWGIDSSADPSVTGVQSGSDIDESITDSNGQTMTLAANGTVTVSVDASDKQERWYVAGDEAEVGVFEFLGTNEPFDLNDLELELDTSSSSASDILEIALFDGSTEIVRKSSPAFSGNDELFSNLSGFTIPKDGDNNLTVKVKFSEVGVGQAGTSGNRVRFSTSTNSSNNEAQGADSGDTVSLDGNVGTTTGARYFRSLPTLAKVDLSNNILTSGSQTLYRFTVTADEADSIAVSKFVLSVATTGVSATELKLVEQDTGLTVEELASLNGSTASFNVGVGDHSNGYIEVAAGETKEFRLDATITDDNTGSDNGSVQVHLIEDASYPSLAAGEVMGKETVLDNGTTNNFVWSPLSTTTNINNNDWTNGYRVPGIEFDDLPSATLTE